MALRRLFSKKTNGQETLRSIDDESSDRSCDSDTTSIGRRGPLENRKGVVVRVRNIAIAPGMTFKVDAWVHDVSGMRVCANDVLRHLRGAVVDVEKFSYPTKPLVFISGTAHPNIRDAVELTFRMIRSSAAPIPGTIHSINLVWSTGPEHFSACLSVKEVDPVSIVDTQKSVITQTIAKTQEGSNNVVILIKLFDFNEHPVPGAGRVLSIRRDDHDPFPCGVAELSEPGVYSATLLDVFFAADKLVVFFGDVKIQ